MSQLLKLPANAQQVLDADEEVFELYTSRAMLTANPPTEEILQRITCVSGLSSSTPLGLVDGKHDIITLRFPANTDGRHVRSEDEIEILLAQDLNRLRSCKGDTGGALWRVSALLANSLVQARLTGSSTKVVPPLDFSILRDARLMELGAGTGLLGLTLAPFVGFYTFTDLPELCRLIEKNINLNVDLLARSPPDRTSARRKKAKSSDDSKSSDRRPTNIAVEPLDWIALYDLPSHSRARLFPVPDPPFDLILATDTIYNPALISPFLATLNHYVAEQRRTFVFLVMELRDEDVTREFLHQWMNLGGWRIWRTDGAGVSEEDIVEPADIPAACRLLDERFASWVAWKE